MESIKVRVARGVALLDEKQPDWRTKMDRDNFFITDTYQCVLGQVFGRFAAALYVLGMLYEECLHFGFDMTDEEYDLIENEALEVRHTYRDEWFKHVNNV